MHVQEGYDDNYYCMWNRSVHTCMSILNRNHYHNSVLASPLGNSLTPLSRTLYCVVLVRGREETGSEDEGSLHWAACQLQIKLMVTEQNVCERMFHEVNLHDSYSS